MISIEATCRLPNATLSFSASGLDVPIYITKLICTCYKDTLNTVEPYYLELGYLELLAVISIFVCLSKGSRSLAVYSAVIALT